MLSVPVQMDKDSDLQVAGNPVVIYGCETWTLNTDLKRRIDVFRRIVGYRWYDFVSNQQLFREIDSRPITSIVRQRQLPSSVPHAHIAAVGIDGLCW